MRSQGDFSPGKTVRIAFNTRDTGGAPITLAGTPAISIYKDGSTTESTAGVTLAVDFDSRTGLHLVTVDTSADGTFYSAGSDFKVVITTGTVATISVVGVCVGAFSLYNRSALRPATADRTLVVDAAGLADANMVKMGPTGAGTAQTARDIGASVLLSAGSGAGQLDFTSGVVKANLVQILGTALTETAGLIAAAFKKFFNVATPTGTVNSIPDAVAGASGGLAIVGSNVGAATSVSGDVGGKVLGGGASVLSGVGVQADVEQVAGAGLATHATGMVPSDVRDIAGSAVNTAAAQLGTNVVSYATGEDPASLVLATPANKLATDANGRVTTSYALHKNTAYTAFAFVMTDSTTGAPKTSLTVTAQRSIDGGAFGLCANSVTEIGNGFYAINLANTDLNGTTIALRFTATGANDTDIVLITQG